MGYDVEGIKAAADIVAVAGSYTALVKAGSEWRGKCPVHGGEHNNFYVVPLKGIWACFSHGCHQAGDYGNDVIGLVQACEGIGFQEACAKLGGVNGAKVEWNPRLSMPPRPKMPDRVTSKPPADAGVPNMEMRHLGKPSKVWEYKDTDGGTLGYVARYETDEGKEIRCWTWGNTGVNGPGWACSHFSKPRPIYSLDSIASRRTAPVLIVEGEKAADAAQAILPAYVAVTWPGGAGAWKHADLTPLAGRRILFWPDNDPPGIKAMSDLAAVLADPKGLACSVKILRPQDADPPLPEGFDAADWNEELHGKVLTWAKAHVTEYVPISAVNVTIESTDTEDTESVAPEPDAEAGVASPSPATTPALIAPSATDPLPPPADAPEPPQSDDQTPDLPDVPPLEGSSNVRPIRAPRKPRTAPTSGGNALTPDLDDEVLPMELSEIGVAKEFCDKYHGIFRVVHEWGGKHGACWLAWNGSRWIREPNRKTAYQHMSALCTGLKYRDAARGLTDLGKSKFETTKFVSACLNQTQFDARLIAAPDVWDSDPMMLGVPGGAVDLKAGKVIEADPEQLITRSTTVAPQQGPHPMFDDVVRRLAGGDADMIAYLWRLFGYTITGCVNEEIFAYVFGKPQTGKTTLSECLADILGPSDEGGYACHVDIDMFTESKTIDSKATDRMAHLAGARYAYASEMEEGRNFKAALLKLAVGGDRLSGRFLYAERFSFRPTHTLYVFGNHIMHLRTADGIKRRLHLLEYNDKFVVTDEERDNDFKKKLKSEYPAILHSLIQGAIDWQQAGGLGRPEQVGTRVDDYLQSEDTLAEFVNTCLTVDMHGRTGSSVAYSAYKSWCEKNGEFCPSGKRFTQAMRARGFASERTRAGTVFVGFTISRDEPPPNYDYTDR